MLPGCRMETARADHWRRRWLESTAKTSCETWGRLDLRMVLSCKQARIPIDSKKPIFESGQQSVEILNLNADFPDIFLKRN
jgi:hypothetical protein